MPLSESDTRAKLIDPAIHAQGWAEDLIRREETAGAIEILDGKPRKSSRGRVDYTLRIKVNPDTQPVAVALTEVHFEEFFRLLPDRADSDHSWTVTREEIDARNYDLKAVNPHAKSEEDTRTPEELLDLIEAKGREVAEALALLRRR